MDPDLPSPDDNKPQVPPRPLPYGRPEGFPKARPANQPPPPPPPEPAPLPKAKIPPPRPQAKPVVPPPEAEKAQSAAEKWAGQRWRDVPLGEDRPKAVPVAKLAQKKPLGGARVRNTADQRKTDVLKPADLDPLKNLILFAQLVVEGWFSGKHRSVDFGTNAEFAEFTNYVQGDPVSDIDWRAYARNRQLVIRKHREEKDMTGYLVVDVSGSMGYSVEGRDSKQLRAARIAASLAYMMQRQGDKSALAMFREDLVGHVPPGATRRHLHDMVSMLERSLDTSMGKTTAHGALDRCIPLFKKRGSVVVISDFFTDLDKFFDAIAQFQHRNIIPVYQVGEDKGTHFYAMQYVDGGDLSDLIVSLRTAATSGEGEC